MMNDTNTATRPAPVEDRILEVLASIRPAIRADGGDIEFVDYDDDSGCVRIRMVGACHACPMSIMTLKAGIEQRLRMIVPEVTGVESVETA